MKASVHTSHRLFMTPFLSLRPHVSRMSRLFGPTNGPAAVFENICGREVAIAELHAATEQWLLDGLIELDDLQLSQQFRRVVLELCDQHGRNSMKACQKRLGFLWLSLLPCSAA